MNVQSPTEADLASELPTSWGDVNGASPDTEWLNKFWTMAANNQWTEVPPCFRSFYLVPMANGQLVSARRSYALSTAHVRPPAASNQAQSDAAAAQQNSAAKLLSAVGCWCILDPRADMVSVIPADTEPITFALAVTAKRKDIPLQQLISEQHLGSNTFMGICGILAKLHVHNKTQSGVQEVLRQCTVFEDISRAQLDLANR